ncbi:NAC domain-containing protein 82-like isoform X2 [Oryza brachyantha]|uniref:NAC domain-containing protein 82-like isoform X2 n=1 Tax=Oryza brachyantha TaxID=4533 RepID=UPI0003EADE54|nr:NAC domain-containing protein 82-like isoform X2 [Oryza brachyantha]
MAQTFLPPGFRFHPTDVELVSYYLKRKIMGKKPLVHAISDVELYKFAPWDLPAQSCLQSRDLEWFFFCPRDKKYANGSRTNRSTPNGYWKTSGKDRTIELNSRMVGSKKTLIFHEGKAPKGSRTDWVMYEYKMEDDKLVSAGFSKDDYVLCKIFKKSGLGPRIGEQYGAPFNEEEWEHEDAEISMFPLQPITNVETSVFPLLPSSEVVNSTGDTCVQPSNVARAIEELPVPHLPDVFTGSEPTFQNIAVTDECAPMELPSQYSVESIVDEVVSVNNCSNEHSGLPPMSEAEAHAFEVSTNDLYNEIAGLAESGVPNGDSFSLSNAGVTEYTSQPTTYFGVPSSENYLDMDDLFAPDASSSYAYPVLNNQFWQYPMDQSIYDSTQSAAFLSSDLHSTMPNFPAVANYGGLASKPNMQFQLS